MLTKTIVTLLVSNIIYIQCFPQLASYSDISQQSQKNQNNVQQNQMPQRLYSQTPVLHQLQSDVPDEQNTVPEGEDTWYSQNNDNNHLSQFDHKSLAKQAAIKNARYHYSYKIDDQIKGGYSEKEEHREDGKVKGSYMYDDREILRKVTYEADKDGFRVISDVILPSQRRGHLNGELAVVSVNDGVSSNYTIHK